jgi:hypothetical protein
MKINGEFESFEEGFSFCRECNRPVIVQIDGKTYRLFPSGKAEDITPKRTVEYWYRGSTHINPVQGNGKKNS